MAQTACGRRMTMGIYSCKGCVAPKRHPGCHDHCPEYLAQKAEYERRKAEYDREKDIDVSILTARGEKVYKAMKDRRRMRT
jgi:hypothetical protein